MKKLKVFSISAILIAICCSFLFSASVSAASKKRNKFDHKPSGNIYYYDENGHTVKGLVTIRGKKYYFNELFKGIPASIQEELHIICVLFTEEIGGIFTIEFDENGNVELRTEYAPEDYLYDDIGSGLLISEVRRKRQELFESLSLYYKAVVLHEDMSELLDEEGL